MVRDGKVLRSDLRIADITGNQLQISTDEEVVIGKEIIMTFILELEYSLWDEKIKLYCANLLNNAIVKKIENMEDGQSRIVYGEKEPYSMYIAYRGFVSEDEAEEERKRIMDLKEEYDNALTVKQYMVDGY